MCGFMLRGRLDILRGEMSTTDFMQPSLILNHATFASKIWQSAIVVQNSNGTYFALSKTRESRNDIVSFSTYLNLDWISYFCIVIFLFLLHCIRWHLRNRGRLITPQWKLVKWFLEACMTKYPFWWQYCI